MARKPKTTAPRYNPETHFSNGNPKPKRWLPDDAQWGGFINVSLNDEELAAFDAWYEAFSREAWDWMLDAVGEGLKLSLAYDGENQTWIATFTGKGMLTDGDRFSMSARDDNAPKAMALLTYKHVMLAEGDWGQYRPKTRSFLKRG